MDKISKSKHVGILGTTGTITSDSYSLEIKKMFPHMTVTGEACPMTDTERASLTEALRLPQTDAPEVKTETIVFKNLPAQWKGTTIALLSDLHVGPVQRKEWLSEIVKRTNDLNPDIVMVTGDFIDGRVQKLLPELEPLKHLKSKHGVYAVSGNHEYYSVYQEWMAALPTLGIKILRNGSDVLTKDGASLEVGGTTDLGASRFGEEAPNVEKTFSGTTPEDFRILLAHQPKTGSLTKEKFDLQLSGHTHGGHIFFMYPLLAYFNDGLVSGFYDRGEKKVYVTNGSGLWNGFTMRVGVPSEITLITLE